MSEMKQAADPDAEWLRDVATHTWDTVPMFDDEDQARLRAIAARLEAQRPVSVEERLPEDCKMVLAYNGYDARNDHHGQGDYSEGWYLAFAYRNHSRGTSWAQAQTGPHAEECDLEKVTHWLPLPPNPTT